LGGTGKVSLLFPTKVLLYSLINMLLHDGKSVSMQSAGIIAIVGGGHSPSAV